MKTILFILILSSGALSYAQIELPYQEDSLGIAPASNPEKAVEYFNSKEELKNLNSNSNGLYIWENTVIMERCDKLGAPLNQSIDDQLSIPGQQFRVINSGDDTLGNEFVVIKILDYASSKVKYLKKTSEKNGSPIESKTSSFTLYNFDENQVKIDNSNSFVFEDTKQYGSAQKYFRIKKEDLNSHSKGYTKIAPSFAFGLLNLPFKARIQSNKADFSGSLNINNAVGITYGHQSWRKMKFTTVLSYGVSSTQLDSISVSRNHNRLTSSSTFPTLTLAIGQVFTFEKIQLGIFLGIDRLSRQNQDTFGWTYNGDPWLSIGFGYSIFSIEKENNNINSKDAEQKKDLR